jgi:hypothetical protein
MKNIVINSDVARLFAVFSLIALSGWGAPAGHRDHSGAVVRSGFAELSYDVASGVLDLTFPDGSRYKYHQVPLDVVKDLRRVANPAEYFAPVHPRTVSQPAYHRDAAQLHRDAGLPKLGVIRYPRGHFFFQSLEFPMVGSRKRLFFQGLELYEPTSKSPPRRGLEENKSNPLHSSGARLVRLLIRHSSLSGGGSLDDGGRAGMRINRSLAAHCFPSDRQAFMQWLIKKIIGSKNERDLKRLRPLVIQINQKELEYQALSEDALKAKTLGVPRAAGQGSHHG